MHRGQRLPERWLVTDERIGGELFAAVRRLPLGSGILFRHYSLSARDRALLLARLRRMAAARKLLLIDEAKGSASRVHNSAEIRSARLRGTRLLFVSPLFVTRSHPAMRPLGRMRAAALARLAGGRAFALGGMSEIRFARVRALGFAGWAGIDAWLEARRRRRRGLRT